ncbi:hypothetical protein EV643_103511 [Kribbella sp. VKM Ac-2527]|uniref:Uncharacterized protein n=1 Tax=Kribbella caucasensis TaxID=2512215 RepID=A0A4V3CAQ5_9ACTN|nr:hypothetical protein [Kribbella sp. VKM Ac-2527]TDO51772.1 hypothetical protein EV643_103511 [Kribbella sp. VKM Ac-2527]
MSTWENGDVWGSDFRDDGGDLDPSGGSELPDVYLFAGHGGCQNPPAATSPDSALAVDPTTVFDFVPYPGAPSGDVDLYLKHETFLTSFATGVHAARPSGLAARVSGRRSERIATN